MTTRKTAADLTNAARAEAVFKPAVPPGRPLDEAALAKKAFDDNRERLKTERLARDSSGPARQRGRRN